jgi:hypothetical protein
MINVMLDSSNKMLSLSRYQRFDRTFRENDADGLSPFQVRLH